MFNSQYFYFFGQIEAAGMMNAHIRDAVALCSWAAFMENEIQVYR